VVDAAFAEIIARWRAEGLQAGPSTTPTGDSVAGESGREQSVPGESAPGRAATEPPRDEDSGDGAAAIDEVFAARRDRLEREIDFAVDGPEGGRFVAPEPGPLPQLDMFTLLAWAAALLGPVLIIIGAFTGGLIPRWILGVAVVATVAGFVVLVSRLPRRSDADPDDDGAVV